MPVSDGRQDGGLLISWNAHELRIRHVAHAHPSSSSSPVGCHWQMTSRFGHVKPSINCFRLANLQPLDIS